MDVQRTLVILLIVVVAGGVIWRLVRSRRMLRRWAAANRYHILRCQRRWLRQGPFLGLASQAQDVFYVVLLDQRGSRRVGWVRVGGWFVGALASRVDVRWEMPKGPRV